MTPDGARAATLRFHDLGILEEWAWVLLWGGCTVFLSWSFLQWVKAGLLAVILVVLLGVMWVELWRALRRVLARPFVMVAITPSDVVLRERLLWRSQEWHYRHADVLVPLSPAQDEAEVEKVYRCVLQLPGGRWVTLARMRTQEGAVALQRRLREKVAPGGAVVVGQEP